MDRSEHSVCSQPRIDEFIAFYTNHMSAKHVDVPEFAVKGILAAYNGSVPENFEGEWVFLPTCTGRGCDYNGSIHYSHTDDFKKITPDDFEALWEQYIAPIICSNAPPWLKYPQSMDQGELESLIGENIWEPEDFVSEVMLPLKACRAPGLVDPFFQMPDQQIRRGALPVAKSQNIWLESPRIVTPKISFTPRYPARKV